MSEGYRKTVHRRSVIFLHSHYQQNCKIPAGIRNNNLNEKKMVQQHFNMVVRVILMMTNIF